MMSRAFVTLVFLAVGCVPLVSHAVNKQADAQCTASGVVGQPCKDTTSGYVTMGHCTHINVCAADKFPKAPRGCQPGQIEGRDCPYGTSSSAFIGGGAPVGAPAIPGTPVSQVGGIQSGILDAFSDPPSEPSPPAPPIIGSASIAGIEYIITADSEALQVGEPLTPAPQHVPLSIGTSYTLRPPMQQEQNRQQLAIDQQSLRSSMSFASNGNNGQPPPSGSLANNVLAMIQSFSRPFGGFTATSSFDANGTIVHQSLFEKMITFVTQLLQRVL